MGLSLSTYGNEVECTDVEPIKMVAPNYPLKESPRPQTGYVIVEFRVSDRGYVFSPEVIESHSEPAMGWAKFFEKEALIAIGQWRFRYRNKACVTRKKLSFEAQK